MSVDTRQVCYNSSRRISQFCIILYTSDLQGVEELNNIFKTTFILDVTNVPTISTWISDTPSEVGIFNINYYPLK